MPFSLNSSSIDGNDTTQNQREGNDSSEGGNGDNGQQQNGTNWEEAMKKMERKRAEMETELEELFNSRIRELEAENKLLHSELRQQKVVAERNELVAKITKMEQQEQQSALVDQIKQLQNDQQKQIEELGRKQTAQFEQLKDQSHGQLMVVQSDLLTKIVKLEREQTEQKEKEKNKWKNESDNWEQTKKTNEELQAKIDEQLLHAVLMEKKVLAVQNELSEKISKMEREQTEQKEKGEKEKEKCQKAFADQLKQLQNDQQKQIDGLMGQLKILQQNYWDANACHGKLEINRPKCLTVQHKAKGNALTDQMQQLKNAQKKEISELEQKQTAQFEQLKNQFNERVLTVQKELVAKMAKMEQKQKEQQKGGEEREKRQKVYADQMKQLQNDQAQINELVGQLKLFQQQNWWDANACHDALDIIWPKYLVVHRKEYGPRGNRSVFAKYPISSAAIFYFEVKAEVQKGVVSIGLGTKEMLLSGMIGYYKNSYGYRSDGSFWNNDSGKYVENSSFSAGDVVGCGANLTNRHIFCTKNGQRLATTYDIPPSLSIDSLFPCISLRDSGDKIKANFCPPFKFDVIFI